MTDERPKVETWENATRGRVVLLKFDRQGDIRREMIRGNQKFTISPEERVLNSDRAATEGLDVFRNGVLTPVRLLDGVEDPAYQEIASNPNMLGESDLRDMYGLHWKTFEKKLAEISNPMTLERLYAIGEEDDTKVTVNQHKAVQARLDEVRGPSAVEPADVEQHGHVRGERSPQGVTPR